MRRGACVSYSNCVFCECFPLQVYAVHSRVVPRADNVGGTLGRDACGHRTIFSHYGTESCWGHLCRSMLVFHLQVLVPK